jgi:hypothetical protein
MGLRIPVNVELDDGRELRIAVDQRDFAKAEAQEIGQGSRHTWVRFLAWSALSRNKLYGGSWEQFNEVDCVEATDALEEPAGADESLDPGRKAPADAS